MGRRMVRSVIDVALFPKLLVVFDSGLVLQCVDRLVLEETLELMLLLSK